MSAISQAVIDELSEEIPALEAAIAFVEPRDPDLAGKLQVILRRRHDVLDAVRPRPRPPAPSPRGARWAASGTQH